MASELRSWNWRKAVLIMANKLTEMDWRVVRTYAKCNMNGSATSRALFIRDNGIDYHLAKVKRLTGLDPKCFYDLVELLKVGEG